MDKKDLQIIYLETRAQQLELLLEQRSRELCLIQKHLDPSGLLVISRILEGLPPLPRRAHDLEHWNESTDLEIADVEETMNDLWYSLTPLEESDE